MRQPLIAGNWKMHGSQTFIDEIVPLLQNDPVVSAQPEFLLLPPSLYLPKLSSMLAGTSISWGAQDISEHVQEGAYTGQISGAMLTDYGASYVLVGHSERRLYNGETDFIVAAKLSSALEAGLTPILCLGENAQERNARRTLDIIQEQLAAVLHFYDNHPSLRALVVAYEPVWAIGTGVNALPAQVQEVHAFIRERLGRCDESWAQQVRIVYGGSLKPDNAAEILSMPDVDGGLIGGASLNAASFLQIGQICNNCF